MCWRVFFTHDDECFEYFLGDSGYIGNDMFIMQRLGNVKRPPDMDEATLIVYNKMHVDYNVKVERGIDGQSASFNAT